jgi:hypothetical protein
MPMTGKQDPPAGGRDDLVLLLGDLACVAGTLSEIATVWRRATAGRPGLPALLPEQLADAARRLAADIGSLSDAGLLSPGTWAVPLAGQSSALQRGIATARAMTCGDGRRDLGDARLWELLRDPVSRMAALITELTPELVTVTD